MMTYCVFGVVLFWMFSLHGIHKAVRKHQEIAQEERLRPKPGTGIWATRPGTFTTPSTLWAAMIMVGVMVTPVVAVI